MNSFIDDMNKIKDLLILSKDEFLKLYSYISESEYSTTTTEILELVESTNDFRKKIFRNRKGV